MAIMGNSFSLKLLHLRIERLQRVRGNGSATNKSESKGNHRTDYIADLRLDFHGLLLLVFCFLQAIKSFLSRYMLHGGRLALSALDKVNANRI